MKANVIFTLILSAALFFTSCTKEKITPSSTISTQSYDIQSFDGIEVSHAFEVEVTFSQDTESVEVEANDNLIDEILVEKIGDRLIIRLANNLTITKEATLKARITTSNANYFEGSGATSFTFTNTLDTEEVEISLSGASHLAGNLEVDDLEVIITGASNIEITGNAQTLDLTASGASNLENYDFATQVLDAGLSGASNVYLTVNESLDVTASGASNLYYRGDGVEQDINVSGASKVQKR